MERSRIEVLPDGTVILVLPGKKYKPRRNLGRIVGDTFVCYKNPKNHVFREGGRCFGFNYELMKHWNFRRVIVRILGTSEYLETTREHILLKGICLNFKINDLELQIYFPISEFGMDKVEPKPPLPDIPPFDVEGGVA